LGENIEHFFQVRKLSILSKKLSLSLRFREVILMVNRRKL